MPVAFRSVNWNHQVWFAGLFWCVGGRVGGKFVEVCACVSGGGGGGGGFSDLPGTTTCCRASE